MQLFQMKPLMLTLTNFHSSKSQILELLYIVVIDVYEMFVFIIYIWICLYFTVCWLSRQLHVVFVCAAVHWLLIVQCTVCAAALLRSGNSACCCISAATCPRYWCQAYCTAARIASGVSSLFPFHSPIFLLPSSFSLPSVPFLIPLPLYLIGRPLALKSS